jgi:subtilase family serine protease
LFARKFRHQIGKTTFSIQIKEEIDKLNKALNTELKDMQEKYDQESNFSRNKETQRKWQRYIQIELKKLSKYK